MKIVFKNENLRFRLDVKDKDGDVVVNPLNVQSLSATFRSEFNNELWLDFRYPAEAEYPEITLESGQFYIEITTEQADTAPTGNVIISVNYKVADASFSEGFNSFTEKGRILLVKEA
jgi:hypothetical protein